MRFSLRLLWQTLLRFLALTIFEVWVENFEVSPLPDWTLLVFAYIVQFFITAGFTRWLFRQQTVTRARMIMTLVLFILGNTLLEILLYLFVIRGDIRDVAANFSWRSLPLLAIHVAAILWVLRKQLFRSSEPLPPTAPPIVPPQQPPSAPPSSSVPPSSPPTITVS